MKFKNHIAYRYLTDPDFIMEVIECMHPAEYKHALDGGNPAKEMVLTYKTLENKGQKVYVVTETVSDKLNLLKVKKKTNNIEGWEQFDWSVFTSIPESNRVFILPDSIQNGKRRQNVLKMGVEKNFIYFYLLTFQFDAGSNNNGKSNNVFFFVDRETGQQCEHFRHDDVKEVEDYVYRLLCFIFLSENEEQIIPAGTKYGTRKSGKVVNEFKFPLTIINSKWNITSIRTEGFGVSGHFAIRWSGEGRKVPKMVFIEPFEKHGYVRKAKSLQNP